MAPFIGSFKRDRSSTLSSWAAYPGYELRINYLHTGLHGPRMQVGRFTLMFGCSERSRDLAYLLAQVH
jgi:hypothetical protein